MTEALILVGQVGRAHGVRGLVRVQSFTAHAPDLARYAPLIDERGGTWTLAWEGEGIARLRDASGRAIDTRDAAERLVNTKLFVARGQLPAAEEDEFYLADLIGLDAVDAGGAPVGRVRAVHDYGGGTFLEIEAEGGREMLVPFTRAAVPAVALDARRVTVVPPDVIEAREHAA